ncbi:MAG: chemotaxis protein CheY [Parcubacteria group bacterium Gr01-1014_73]|nr:MAG: chemotaxis protein CheY [Parcubacteria group bacterium Gr01-1014_73]
MKILLVEDYDSFRKILRIMLESRGYEIVEATDKGSACRIIQESVQELDLILTDCDLPAPDEGLEVITFAQDIIDFFGHKNVPMILMSGREKNVAAQTIGAEFLFKPFGLNDFKAALDRALARNAEHELVGKV